MKVCIMVPTLGGGGAERVAVNFANWLSGKKVKVYLLVVNLVGSYVNQVSSDVEIVDLKVKRMRYSIPKTIRVIREISPTHVVSVMRSCNIVLGLSSLFFNRPAVVFREATTMDRIKSQNGAVRFFNKAMLKLCYKQADIVIANSNATRGDVLGYGLKSEDSVIVIGNPVIPGNFESLAEEDVSHVWKKKKRCKYVLTVGRLHPVKNQKILIEAFRLVLEKLPNTRLVILGDGPEKNNLVAFSKKIGVYESIDFIPFQPNPYPFYRDSDLFVLTSKWEGFGNVVVEALSCGTPVVSLDSPGGVSDILGCGKYGTLVSNGDVVKLGEAIADSLTGKVSYSPADLKGRARMYSIDSICDDYLDTLKGLSK